MAFRISTLVSVALSFYFLLGCSAASSSEKLATWFAQKKFGPETKRIKVAPQVVTQTIISEPARKNRRYYFAIPEGKFLAVEVLQTSQAESNLQWKSFGHDGAIDSEGSVGISRTH